MASDRVKNIARLFCRFRECESGVTAIEFAFVSPVLIYFIIGILEFSMIFLATNVLENAVGNAARLGKTGYVTSGESREQTMKDEIAARIGGFIKPNDITVTSTTYDSFDQVGQAEPFIDSNANGVYDYGETYTDVNGNGMHDDDMGSAGQGNAGQVVVYRIDYPWHLMTPLLGNFLGDDGVFTISTRIVVKNEPYSDAGS